MSDNRYVVGEQNLKSVADAIRERGGTAEALRFPDGFTQAIRDIGDDTPEYEGEYEVEPLLDTDQTLPTNGKKMTNDLTVKGMAVHIVHNPQGGLTYYIGGNENA